MPGDEISHELAACLDQLRLILAGIRAGGVDDWASTPESDSPDRRGKDEELPSSPLCEEQEEEGILAPCPSANVPAVEAPLSRPGMLKGAPEDMPLDCLNPSPANTSEPAFLPECAPPPKQRSVSDIMDSLAGCTRCRLHSGRKNLVFGEGSIHSGIVFVGEGPGFEEDQKGRPFVGKAGKLLDKMIGAIGFNRTDTYICNVVKCRPPENRTPLPDEIAACSPFLFRQLEALQPKVICALGACAAQSLLGTSIPISQARRNVHKWRGIPLICTYHPAYLLRNSAHKAATWQDLKEVLRVLGQA